MTKYYIVFDGSNPRDVFHFRADAKDFIEEQVEINEFRIVPVVRESAVQKIKETNTKQTSDDGDSSD